MSRVMMIGGGPRTLMDLRGRLLKVMREHGHEVIACAGGRDKEVEVYLRGIGVSYVSLPLKRTSLNPVHDILFLHRLIILMRKYRPDVVVAYNVKPVIYGLFAARQANVQRKYALITGLGYAFSASSSIKQKLLSGLVSYLYRFVLSGAETIFFQNNDDLELFHQRDILRAKARTLRVMGSGVDLERFTQTPHSDGKVVFLLIARLLVDKGIREYFSAASIVRQSNPDVCFALLGPFDKNPAGIGRKELQEWIDEGVVDYWGDTADVRPALARCNVFVLPSYREGLPHSVLEAMAMGRAVITTDVPGCRDTVENGINGYLVPARDATALANVMLRCLELNAPLVAMGGASRALVERQFDVDLINKVLMERMKL